MGLTSALNIGQSGLQTAQSGVEVTGNNLSNLATRGFHRRRIDQAPLPQQRIDGGQSIGRGVNVQSITRQVDNALESRLRDAIGQESRSTTREDLLSRIESIENELTDVDLSSQLSEFFNGFSQLANKPRDLSLRKLVVQQGRTLTDQVRSLRQNFNDVGKQINQAIGDSVSNVNDLLNRIEQLNTQIARAEGVSAGGNAAGLRDQRGQALSELAQYLDVSTVEQSNGAVDVFVGSLPIVLNGDSRGIALKTDTVDGQSVTDVVIKADGSRLDISSGKVGAQVRFGQDDLQENLDTLDKFASQLIYQTNRVHSQGQALEGHHQLSATNQVADPTAALNSKEADLDFKPEHGSFEVHVTNASTGLRNTRVMDVDLDGINPASDTTLQSLASDLSGVAGVNASISPNGELNVNATNDNLEFSFSDDSAGVLASLGLGGFFQGTDSFDIGVSPLVRDPNKVAAGRGHLPGDNRNALALAGLGTQGLSQLTGSSLSEFWDSHVADLASRTAQARDAAEADAVVRENLKTQRQATSGVNADEQTINLMQHQRAYQASARFINVVDEMMDTLLGLA